MARVAKTGLSYIPVDIDIFDDPKLLRIEDQFGLKGGYITLRLLFWIYRDGYYTIWDDNTPYIFAKRVGNGVTGSLVNEVVGGLLKCSFFNEEMFKRFSILTSKGIQKRWLKIINDSNRTSIINPEHDLLNIEPENQRSDNNEIKSDKNEIKSDLIQEKSEVMQQRKEKEKKEKKR